ncbi:hypothetical protein CYY_004310 [Polysphondylium violaceum]|uniref:FAD dependent oxidoreductase domain-containing protein n=1 Tax=Polysphondylium violaceum TaxID=133409 RepID=A0A8J4PVL3_9MYCE|nr:hypothetical protein CYY_004310 [Polysphondylium violaceum]
MTSFWEKESFLNYDYIIIGSGIVGLSTAISIKESKGDGASVLVMEREIIPTGASTKNAGFACIGSLTEILDDLKTMSEKEVVELVKTRLDGLRLLRKRLGDDNIGYKENGSYELISKDQPYKELANKVDEINALLYPVLECNAFTICPQEEIDRRQFDRDHIKLIIKNNLEGEIHTGKMMKSYLALANKMGVEIKNGCDVSSFKDYNTHVEIEIQNKAAGKQLFTCQKLAICTNAFTKSLVPDIEDLVPGRGQVCITEPIPDLPFKGVHHFDEGYYYFRETEGRILFGGGRNMDFKGEETTEFEFNEKIQNQLVHLLKTVIIPNRPFTIASKWTGIMAFGSTKKPIIKNYSKNVVLGVRMGGMGVAIGSLVGQKVRNLLLLNSNL